MTVVERSELVFGTTWRYCEALADAGNVQGAALLSELLCEDWPPGAGDEHCPGCGCSVSAACSAEHKIWCALSAERLEAQELEELAALWGE